MKGLDVVVRETYKQKLQWRGQELPDPLDGEVVQFIFSTGVRNLPPVTAADTCMYLVEGVCFYTKEQFKCYKISDAYNVIVSGKVRQLVSSKRVNAATASLFLRQKSRQARC
ncbi:hypothetical protein HPB48_011458 [Haemaphysalis longicornis]|uniref:Uncharacterized protein n=1 Tax=Haemaphysalis longicornis TaxID=44386 RepID=A0A9J6FCW4_HAELO|nr:hypothetical protein HPB48_011458 [Haemaphysalis longicornis]